MDKETLYCKFFNYPYSYFMCLTPQWYEKWEMYFTKKGIILEKDITVDINRNPNAILTVINASNYSESYAIDVLPIMKKYNCYIFDYLIVNDELYLLARSNDTISNMNLYPLLILRVTDTSLTANVIGYDFDKFSASLDYINGNIIASNREGKYILDCYFICY